MYMYIHIYIYIHIYTYIYICIYKNMYMQVTLEFQHEFDTNGALYHIAMESATDCNSAYINPHSSNRVVASFSCYSGPFGKLPSYLDISPGYFVQGPCPTNFGMHSYTKARPNSWMAVDLKRILAPSHYCLRSDMHGSHKLRNWQMEGSKDGVSWTCLSTHVNDSSLSLVPCSMASWPIDNTSADEFRHFRILQTGPNSSGDHHLMCAGIELYGTLQKEQLT